MYIYIYVYTYIYIYIYIHIYKYVYIDAVIRLTGSRVRELNLLKVRVLIELNRISEAYNLTNSMMKENGSSIDMELISVRGMYIQRFIYMCIYMDTNIHEYMYMYMYIYMYIYIFI
jgi:hypothetical protein